METKGYMAFDLGLGIATAPRNNPSIFIMEPYMFLIETDRKSAQTVAISIAHAREDLSHTSTIRDTMLALPGFTQPFITWLTGKSATGQRRTHHTAIYHLVTALSTLLTGWAMVWAGLSGGLLFCSFLVLGGMIFAASAMRKLQIVIIHHCSHSNFFGRRSRWNTILGNVLSFFLFVEPFASYRTAHIKDHHFSKHMTIEDPTVTFLFEQVGLRPGMSIGEAKRQMFMNFVSPKFYLKAFLNRCRQQTQMRFVGKAALTIYWFSLIAGASKLHLGYLLFFGLIVPLFFLYPISSALRLAVEHTFPKSQSDRKFDLKTLHLLTNAVYCGEPFPLRANSPSRFHHAGRVLRWILKMSFVHLPVRFFVLVGDTPVHDHHHRHPTYKDWPNYAFARVEAYKSADAGSKTYREVWGYFRALEHSLESLNKSKGWYEAMS